MPHVEDREISPRRGPSFFSFFATFSSKATLIFAEATAPSSTPPTDARLSYLPLVCLHRAFPACSVFPVGFLFFFSSCGEPLAPSSPSRLFFSRSSGMRIVCFPGVLEPLLLTSQLSFFVWSSSHSFVIMAFFFFLRLLFFQNLGLDNRFNFSGALSALLAFFLCAFPGR